MADKPNSDRVPIQVLLWSLRGSGDEYHGPGTFSFRLYSQRDPRTLRVSLAHANPLQEQLDVFDRQCYLGRLTPLARLNSFFLAGAVARWVRNQAGEFQIFHALTDYHHAILPSFAAQRAGMRAVVFIANSGAGLADAAGWQRVFGLAVKRREMAKTLSGIIAMSSQIERELLSYGIQERRICRIPNQADVTRFRPPLDAQEKSSLREQLGLRDLPTVILNGKIGWRKRPHLVVEAAEILQRQGLDVQTVFVGPLEQSDYGDNFQLLCDRSPLGELIVRAGFSREIERYLRAADVLCLPSENEGMPAAAVEALATGLPLVLTDFSGRAIWSMTTRGWVPSSSHPRQPLPRHSVTSCPKATWPMT